MSAISKADVLETFADLYDVFEDNKSIRKELDKVYDRINALPSVTPKPEQQWISVSERLPDKETYVLISKKPRSLTGKKWCVTIAGRFVDGRSRELEWRDIGFGRIADDEILAWCELPEPYREEGEG